MQRYCRNCNKMVSASRNIGVGTLILCLVTAGFWILVIPFYSKKCPICKGKNHISPRRAPKKMPKKEKVDLNDLKKLKDLKDQNFITDEEYQEKRKKFMAKI